MDCQNLNETTYKKIQNALEGSKINEYAKENSAYKSIYSSGTLINNWLENRSNAGKNVLELQPPVSEYMDEYRKLCVSNVPDRREYFNKIFEGLGCGQELLIDHLGFSYYGNYVSTYDLCYNHLTKGTCGPYPRHYFKGEYKPSTDLSLIYGNLTQWGLKERIYKKIMEHNNEDIDPVSENRAEYIAHNPDEIKKLNNFPSFKKIRVIY